MTTTSELIKELMQTHNGHGCESESTFSEAAQRLRELDKPDCVWTFDEDQDMYDTGCGEAWMFSEGSRLAEHSVKFCPFCGGAVKEDV